jgi:hypothetical protein
VLFRSNKCARFRGAQQRLPLPEKDFTLVIELDAWNIRERDDWGQSAQRRAAGQEPQRWHWVYGGTCFRLEQRVHSPGGRPRILSRGTVMTRQGVDPLREQLFAQAHQRLDYYHASQHLWTVAHALHPEDEAAARAWVSPLLQKLKKGRAPAVLTDLRALVQRLRHKKRQAVAAELAYLESRQERMDYAAARRAGEPLGSGAMESTCRQYQCRFKRPGPFWSCAGDEALMCLETFWRNGRWPLLFPHSTHGDPCKN